MAIAAHLGQTPESDNERGAARRSLLLETRGAFENGLETNVLVHNASATGLLVESRVALKIGEELEIDLPEAGDTLARVVWVSGELYGCEFKEPVSTATLAAAELRSAVGESVDFANRHDPKLGETLGSRIQRLRKQRRMTMAQVAEGMGVSKPTVWAWEHGKARPVEHRLDALAQVLGARREDLMPGSSVAALSQLVEESRIRIAGEVGTTPDKIRIAIEL